jgi:hypothetical protein
MSKTIVLSLLLAIVASSLPAAIVTDVTGPYRPKQSIGFNKTCHDGPLRQHCIWDWGDGTFTHVANDSDLGWIYHTYVNPGTYQVRYERSNFTGNPGAQHCGGTGSWSESFTITIVPLPVHGEVRVLLAEISLDNGKSYKVVPKASRNIEGILRLKMRGTGVVSGYWLVDDQPFDFFETLAYQGEIKPIHTRAIPGLPTIQPGLHTLTVRLNRPVQEGIVFPVLKYFVLPYANTILLIAPPDDYVAKETEKPEFSWQPASGAARYQIAFANEVQRLLLDTPPLVWIDTLDRTVMVPGAETWQSIMRNRPAYWKVRALDSLGNVLAESMLQQFKIIVPGARLTFTAVTDLDGNPLAIANQSLRSKNGPILVKGQIQYMSDAEYLILRVIVDQTLSDQLVIRDYRLGESRSFETSLTTGPGDITVEFQVLRSSSPSVIIGSEQLLVMRSR